MIMIFSASQCNPRINEQAPNFFEKHFNYLKDKHPEHFNHQTQRNDTQIDPKQNDVDKALARLIESLYNSC